MATTLKLPEDLKQRIKAVAEGNGKTPHAFMVEAIERETALAERRKAFVDEAIAGRDRARRTGKAYAFEDVKSYYLAKAAGKPAKRPRLKRWRA